LSWRRWSLRDPRFSLSFFFFCVRGSRGGTFSDAKWLARIPSQPPAALFAYKGPGATWRKAIGRAGPTCLSPPPFLFSVFFLFYLIYFLFILLFVGKEGHGLGPRCPGLAICTPHFLLPFFICTPQI
jgi:hypothetical protein